VGDWLRADIAATPPITATAGTVYTVSGNTKGFWLQGSATGAFAATVTVPLKVELAGVPIFGWCAYATDRPPAAIAKPGGYTLQGTPPFIIQTHPTNTSSTVSEPSHNYTECNIYKITDATGCPGDNPPLIPSINSFTASTTSICVGQSATLTAAATNAERYSFDNGATWGNSASTVVSPSTTTTYTLKVTRTAGGCTVTYGTPIEITVRPTPAPAFVNPPTCLEPDTDAVLTVNDPTGTASSYCFRYECADCVHNPYLTGNDEPAAAGCYWFPECEYGGANTYTVSMYDYGTIAVWAKAKTQYGCVDSTHKVIATMGTPVISGASSNTCPETSVTLTATATGATSFTWYKNDVPVQSGTMTTYTVSTSGSYTVMGVNEYCSSVKSSVHFVSRYCCSEVTNENLEFIQTTLVRDGISPWATAKTTCENQGYRLPSSQELGCLCAEQHNVYAVNTNGNILLWSSEVVSSTQADARHWGNCGLGAYNLTNNAAYRCVK
jgi:hypothetical protein